MNVDEDLTMINLPRPTGSDKENVSEGPAVNGKVDARKMNSPARQRTRTNSRDDKIKSVNGPLSTFAKDLKTGIPILEVNNGSFARCPLIPGDRRSTKVTSQLDRTT
jgi:hypothetical protein